MRTRVSDYAKALCEAVSERPDQIRQICQGFLRLLQKDRAVNLLPMILEKVETIEFQKERKRRIEITTTQPLEDQDQQFIKQHFDERETKGWTVEVINRVDPSILGGVRLRVGDITIDHTVSRKLRDLASRL